MQMTKATVIMDLIFQVGNLLIQKGAGSFFINE